MASQNPQFEVKKLENCIAAIQEKERVLIRGDEGELLRCSGRVFSAFCKELVINKVCKELVLEDCDLEDRLSTTELLGSLESNLSISYLQFSSCEISGVFRERISGLVERNMAIKIILLDACDLGDDVCSQILIAVKNNPRITTVELWNCETGTKTAKAAVLLLKEKANLIELSLTGNNFVSKDLEDICSAAVENHTLEILRLRENEADNRTIAVCAKMLKNHPSLKKFSVGTTNYAEQLEKDVSIIKNAILSGETSPHNRSKLMIFGKGGAGKTSTLRSLFGLRFIKKYNSTIVADAKEAEISLMSGQNWSFIDEFNQFSGEFGMQFSHVIDKHATDEREKRYIFDEILINDDGTRNSNFNTRSGMTESSTHDDEITRGFHEVVKFQNKASEFDKVLLSIYDFGGQDVFKVINHLFASDKGILFVIFDLNKFTTKNTEANEQDVLHSWLKILLLSNRGCPVFLIGTHFDLLSNKGILPRFKNKRLKEISETVEEIIQTVGISKLVAKNGEYFFFPLNNKGAYNHPQQVKAIRQAVDRIFDKKYNKDFDISYLSEAISVAWPFFLQVLLNKKVEAMFLDEIIGLGDIYGFTLEEILKMLRRYHVLGTIIYLELKEHEQKKQLVVFKPNWLVKVSAAFIYDVVIHKTKRQSIGDEVDNYETYGVIEKDALLKVLWKDLALEPQKESWLLDMYLAKYVISPFVYELDKSKNFSRERVMSQLIVPGMNQCLDHVEVPENTVSFFVKCEPSVPMGLFERVLCLLTQKGCEISSSEKPRFSKLTALFWYASGFYFYVKLSEADSEVQFYLDENNARFSHVLVNFCESVFDDFKKDDSSGFKWRADILLEGDGASNGVKPLAILTEAKKQWERLAPSVLTVNRSGKSGATVPISVFEVFRPPFAYDPTNVNAQYDCFLSYTWGLKDANDCYETHERLLVINQLLQKAGISTWFDENNLNRSLHIAHEISKGLRSTKFVLVFLTKAYLDRVENQNNHVSQEFKQACSRDLAYVIPIVLEENLMEHKNWNNGVVDLKLGDKYRVDMSHINKYDGAITTIQRIMEEVEQQVQAN